MKINQGKETLEVIGTDVEVLDFNIKDPIIIVDYLTSTIYSNPLRMMLQEIMTNARDANIEADRGTEPINITLPTKFDSNIIISDHGIGISPERMCDIFINYGSSTKRNTNRQSGGFGIGAKTPFAYSNTFQVNTVYKDADGNKYRSIYSMIKEGNGIAPKATKVSCEQTTDKIGTSIIIPIKSSDIISINKYISEITHKWKIRPIFHNNTNNMYEEYDKNQLQLICEGDKFKFYRNNQYKSTVKIFIDEIPYNIDWNSQYSKFLSIPYSYTIELYFKTGDVNVSLNRESIHRDDFTLKNLTLICDNIKQQITEYLNSVINKYEKFIDACDFYVVNKKLFCEFVKTPIVWKDKIGATFTLIEPITYLRLFRLYYYDGSTKKRFSKSKSRKHANITPYFKNVVVNNNISAVNVNSYIRGYFNKHHIDSLCVVDKSTITEILKSNSSNNSFEFCNSLLHVSSELDVLDNYTPERIPRKVSTLQSKDTETAIYFHTENQVLNIANDKLNQLPELISSLDRENTVYLVAYRVYNTITSEYINRCNRCKDFVSTIFMSNKMTLKVISKMLQERGINYVYITMDEFKRQLASSMCTSVINKSALVHYRNLFALRLSHSILGYTDSNDITFMSPYKKLLIQMFLRKSISAEQTISEYDMDFIRTYYPNIIAIIAANVEYHKTLANKLRRIGELYISFRSYYISQLEIFAPEKIKMFSQYNNNTVDENDCMQNFLDTHEEMFKKFYTSIPSEFWNMYFTNSR